MQQNTGFMTLVKDAKQRIDETNVYHVKERLDNTEQFHLIDVREEREWVQGHLPGALHLSKGLLECKIEQLIPDKSETIVLYCGGGYRSALATDALLKMGYQNVISMDGGIHDWCRAGFSIVTDD